jgi:hypothetical protein
LLTKEKLELLLQNAKIKEVLQFGQLTIEGNQKETGFVDLCDSEHFWNNSKVINKRISPSSSASVTDLGTRLKYPLPDPGSARRPTTSRSP